MKKLRGLTLLELIISVVVIVVICGIGSFVFQGCTQRGAKAEAEMREYVTKLYPNNPIVGVACTNVDTNHDGYITCAATISVGSGTSTVEKQINAECTSGILTFNSGCKPMIGYPNQ